MIVGSFLVLSASGLKNRLFSSLHLLLEFEPAHLTQYRKCLYIPPVKRPGPLDVPIQPSHHDALTLKSENLFINRD